MNPLFPVIATLMAAAALVFVLWPLLRKGARGKVVILAIVLAFVLPASALGLYVWIGTPAALDANAEKAPQPPQVDMAAAVTQLQARLEKNPEDLDGWTLLARSYEAMKQQDKASNAWARAVQLAPENADILVASAEASSLSQAQHQITPQARTQLDKALKIDPDNQRGLWLMGISDYQQGRFTEAASTWQHLLSQIDARANPEVAAAVSQQIARARDAAGMPAGATSSGTASTQNDSSQAAASPVKLKVHVSLAPTLRDKPKPQDTVFVFARAVKGPPMPLAVKRLTVADLPADVTLTDAMAMSPQLKLSMFTRISVSARISASGQAISQAGDLEANPETVTSRTDRKVSLTIDHAIP
ncbi:MAG: hypothetical protein WCD36_00255 [Rhodanobacteraceae bacterium]